MILSALSALIAVTFLARHNYDNAFVCAALGAVAWFLRYRAQIKEMVKANEPAESLDSNEEE
jgi:hypothetical protein